MHRLVIKPVEVFNNSTQSFDMTKGATLTLEHSLVSLSKWEAKWRVPFLSDTEKTREQVLDYIMCMNMTQNVDPEVLLGLTSEDLEGIQKYIAEPMTATTIKDTTRGGAKEVVTAEIIYYWMVHYQIPIEFQKWHLNRLLTLISVCHIKSQPPKKVSKAEATANRLKLNADRRAKLGSRG